MTENDNVLAFQQVGNFKKVTTALLVYDDDPLPKVAIQLTNRPGKFLSMNEIDITHTFFPQYQYLPYVVTHLKQKDNKCQVKTSLFEQFFKEGDLFNWQMGPSDTVTDRKKKLLSVQDYINVYFQIGTDIKKLHDKDLVHFDIKEENILIDFIDGDVVARLTDFGWCKAYNHESMGGYQGYGTLECTSPERIRADKQHPCDPKAEDMFALGLSLIGTMSDIWLPGAPHWIAEKNEQIALEVDKKKHTGLCVELVNSMNEYLTEIDKAVSLEEHPIKKELYKIIQQLILVDYQKRMKIDEFMKKIQELKK